MKANLKFVWLAALLVAGVALAVRQVKYSLVNDPNPQAFQAGLYLGGPYSKTDPTTSTLNRLGHRYCGVGIADIAAAKGANGGVLQTVCPVSGTITVAGCKFGDSIALGVDQTLINNQGTVIPVQLTATTFQIQACAVGISDGGSFDMPDASYTVCCEGP